MIKILCHFLVVHLLLIRNTSAGIITDESSASECIDDCIDGCIDDCMSESICYDDCLPIDLDVVEQVEHVSESVGSLLDVDCCVLDDVQTIAGSAGSTVTGLIDYASLINADSFMSIEEKARYLEQIGQFSSVQVGAVTDLLGMLPDQAYSHFQHKMSSIREAQAELALAMEAIACGDAEAISAHVLSVISNLQDCCPICSTLRYALLEDQSLLPFVGGLSQCILSRMEMAAETDVSICD